MTNNLPFTRFEAALADDAGLAVRGEPESAPDILDLTHGPAVLAALMEPRPLKIFDSWFVLQRNVGGGDCLFHALEGRDLDGDALGALRAEVAEVRLHMPDDPRGNARRVIAALLQTPWARHLGLALVQQRIKGLSNRICAALQAVPGVHAGEDEIEQWCALNGRIVVVIDADGTLREITKSGSVAVPASTQTLRDTVSKFTASGNLTLFKTPGHWRRIIALRQA